MAIWSGPVWAEGNLYLVKDRASQVSWEVLDSKGRRGSHVCLLRQVPADVCGKPCL